MSRSLLHDDSGAVAVIVALCLVMLIGFAALVVDLGYAFDARHQLQAAADAGALAGCQRLIEGGSAGEAEAIAREYCARNANGPAAGLAVDSVQVDNGSEPWSVRVQVSRTVPTFFGGIFGETGTLVRTAAKAQKGRLSGARYLVPWAIPIIRDEDVDHIEVDLASGGAVVSGPVTLSRTAPRTYEGVISAPSAAGGYDAFARIYNVFGIVEEVGDSHGPQPVARVVVGDADYPITSISVSGDYIPSDDPSYPVISVVTKEPETGVKITIDRATRNMTGSGTSWSYQVSGADLSFDNEFLNTFPIDIKPASEKGRGVEIDTYLHVRRSTYPVADVWTDPIVAAPGGSVSVSLKLNDFDPTSLVPGQIYTLRVASDGVESGNFGELNFKKITHTGDCPPDPPGVDLGNNYSDWLSEGYGGGVHEGDIISLSPGGSGGNTGRALDERAARYGEVIVAVPIVTKYEQKSGGAFDVIVRELAAFKVLDWGDAGGSKGEVQGEFIEYIATTSTYYPPGSGGGTVYAAHLVNP